MTSDSKFKRTLFSQTFKIEENKVPLFFRLEVKWMKVGENKVSLFFIRGNMRDLCIKTISGKNSILP